MTFSQAEKAYARYVRSVGYSIDETSLVPLQGEECVGSGAASQGTRTPRDGKLHATATLTAASHNPVIKTAIALRKRMASTNLSSDGSVFGSSIGSLHALHGDGNSLNGYDSGYETPVGRCVAAADAPRCCAGVVKIV